MSKPLASALTLSKTILWMRNKILSPMVYIEVGEIFSSTRLTSSLLNKKRR